MNELDNSNRWLALGVILIGTFMGMLGTSLVNLAIPKMMSVFGVTLSDVTWVLTAYTLALGAIVPLAGFLCDTIGVKKLYILALTLFTVGSALCGLAWSNSAMIVFRILQALGGGLMTPVGMTIIFMLFPMEERGKAMGLWGMGAAAAPALGPTLGGYILSHLDWRLLFYINVPIGIMGIIFAILILKETPTKFYAGNFDIIGFITSVVGIACTLYVVGKWSTIEWKDIQYPILLILGIGNLVLFVVNELTHPNPLLELRVLKVRDFALSQLITIVTVLALMGGSYVLPLYLQNGRGYTAMQSGLILLPSAISSAILMPISGGLAERLGAKLVTIPGLIILALCSYELSFVDAYTPDNQIILISFIRGIGLGLAMMPVGTVGMNALPSHLAARASALSNTIRNIFGSVSVTIIASLLTNGMNNNYARMAEQITQANQPAVNLISQLQGLYTTYGLTQADAKASALSTVSGLLQKQAYFDSIDFAIAFTVIAIILAIPLVLLMENPKKVSKRKEIEYAQNQQPAAALD